MTFAGWVATVAGWYVTEIDRQPYLVEGILRTADAASGVPAPMIGLTLTAYLLVYVFLLGSFITTLFYMARKAGEGANEPSIVQHVDDQRSIIYGAE